MAKQTIETFRIDRLDGAREYFPSPELSQGFQAGYELADQFIENPLAFFFAAGTLTALVYGFARTVQREERSAMRRQKARRLKIHKKIQKALQQRHRTSLD